MKMKLRVRFRKITKVFEINDDTKDTATVLDIKEPIAQLFTGNISGDIELSLNNKDVLADTAKLVQDCEMVSGDLIYIIADGAIEQNEVKNERPQLLTEQGASCSYGGAGESSSSNTSVNSLTTNFSDNPPVCSSSMECASTVDVTQNIGTNIEDMDEDEMIDHRVVSQCLSEPVLCREATNGQTPALLREMYYFLKPTNSLEALAVVIHVLMIETGFCVQTEDAVRRDHNFPDNWRNTGYLKFTYTYPGCADTACSVTILSTGKSAAVHGKVLGSDASSRQCALVVSNFVSSTVPESCDCYTDLAKLSRVFKDSVASCLVQDMRLAVGLEVNSGLLSLIYEVQMRILSYLDVRSLLNTSRVHSQLYSACNDQFLWRRLYLREFGNRRDNSLSQNWKQMYKDEFKSRKERRKMMNRAMFVTPPLWNPANPFSGPSNWVPPVSGGIIGGDYDLYPNFPSSLPGVPGRLGPRPPVFPQPRYDLIGPGVDPSPDPLHIPRRPSPMGRGGRAGPFGGFGPRFF